MSSDMITIKVGPAHVRYQVHEAILTHYSEYFLCALRSGLQECRTRVITLEDVHTCTFDAFLDWLYTQKLATYDGWDDRYPCDESHYEDQKLVEVYAFADRFVVAKLKPVVMALLIHCFNNNDIPSHAAIIFAVDNLPAESPVLRLLVDVFCRSWDAATSVQDEIPFEALPSSFLRQAILKYSSTVSGVRVLVKAEDYQEIVESKGEVVGRGSSKRKQKTRG